MDSISSLLLEDIFPEMLFCLYYIKKRSLLLTYKCSYFSYFKKKISFLYLLLSNTILLC